MPDNSLLYYFVRDSLKSYSENLRFTERNNPLSFMLNGTTYSLHISYIHFADRMNPDEYRIQIDRAEFNRLRQRQAAGHNVRFIGVFEGGEVFVGWEEEYGFSLNAQQRVSLYCRLSQLGAVEANGSAIYDFRSVTLGRRTRAIALPVRTLGFYIENSHHFHHLVSDAAVQQVIREHPVIQDDAGLGAHGQFQIDDNGIRERFTFERTAFLRDPRFKKAVLGAYARTCCICNRQLGLVQAAHIVPHSEPDSPNAVENGLALCIEHHRLYDDALLLPGPGQRLIFNQQRATYLRDTGQDRGLDGIAAFNDREYAVPADVQFRPREEYLARGLAIRMG